MINTIKNVDKIDPKDCRREIEERFSATPMTVEYERVYKSLLRLEIAP